MLISFILPAYKAKFFRQAIDSILSQEYSDLELIIVNDKSPEDIEEIVKSYSDPRIRYYENEENIGGKSLVAQWNHCIKYANGDYLILAADDDIYNPQFLTECVNLAQKYPDIDLVRARVKIINENNELIGIDSVLPEYISKYGYLYYYMVGASFTCIGNFMFKTSVIKSKKFIDYPCAFGSDTSSTIMMAENGCACTKEMLFNFRISSIHLSSSKSHLNEKLEAITMLFCYIKNLNYKKPNNEIDNFYYKEINQNYIYDKCKYDYYNLVIKYLPISKIETISKCSLLNSKDKLIMSLRFLFDKIFK